MARRLARIVGDDVAKLAMNNTGLSYVWDADYWTLHDRAWDEAARVMQPDGIFVLNTGDFIRNGEVVSVTRCHIDLLAKYRF